MVNDLAYTGVPELGFLEVTYQLNEENLSFVTAFTYLAHGEAEVLLSQLLDYSASYLDRYLL